MVYIQKGVTGTSPCGDMSKKYHRARQYRLPYFNYASTAYYFVTLRTKEKQQYFGKVCNGVVELSAIGKIVKECFTNLPRKLHYLAVDVFVIMPDHVHLFVLITNPGEERTIREKKFQPEKRSLSLAIRNLKATTTLLVRRRMGGVNIWHRRFYDHIVRNEDELNRIRTYIRNNSLRWDIERNHPQALLI